MNSMYRRMMTVMLSLIALCMALLGTGFAALSYRYHQGELRQTVQRDITYISNFVNAGMSSGTALASEYFLSYLSSVALISNTTILLCQTDGSILHAAGKDMANGETLARSIPSWATGTLLQDRGFEATTSFNGLFSAECYVIGVPIVVYAKDPITGEIAETGATTGLLFIAADATATRDLLVHTLQLFFITAAVVLLISVLVCSVMAQRMTDPLKVMRDAAHRFARGDVNTRVTQYTERKDEIGELAVAFNAMADSLAQAEQKRSEFVANVSHELKTPMTTIAGFADGILDGTIPPEKERESLQVISSETRRLSRLVRRMLELSRLQSSERVAAQEQFDAEELLLRVLVSLEAKITEKGLEVETHLPAGPVPVWGDPDAVTQVCYNLLDNAIKFSTPGGKLTLSVASRGGKAYISIANEGETIPPDQLSHIFDRFHKADASRASHKEGVGLGLYIVKTLLNAYKEDITVTSENGVTDFTFTLSEV